jgi:hypothetical protein
MKGDRVATRSEGGLARQFSQSAKTLRLNSLITGVDTARALEIALAADVEFVSGTAVLPASDTPFKQRSLTLADTEAARASFGEPSGRSVASSPTDTSSDSIDFV